MPRRRSPRLSAYDYREPGMYFITNCTHDRVCVFGEVINDEVVLSPLGRIAHDEWERTPTLRPYVHSEAFIVMPNHVHLLFGLWTEEAAGMRRGGPPHAGRSNAMRRDTMHGVPTVEYGDALDSNRRFQNHGARSVASMIGTYKAAVTRLARRTGVWGEGPLWQGRYHDRVVRNERERNAFHEYILDNPRQWHEDRFYAPTVP